MKKYLLLFSIAVFLFSCNKDEEISQDVTVPPVIELDSEDGIYVVKIGKEVVIEPTYQNVDYAVYSLRYPAGGHERCQRGRGDPCESQ